MFGFGRRSVSALLLQLCLLETVAAVPFRNGVSLVPEARRLQGNQGQGNQGQNKQQDNEEDATMTEADDGKIFPYAYSSYKLTSNGLPVVIMPLGDDFPGIVSVHITVLAGSRNELEPGKTGMAHFFEHMMFRGTENIPSDAFDAIYLEMGASYNAWTWMDATNYHVTFPKAASDGESNFEKVMLMEADRFQNINYTLADFKTEAGAIQGEYNYRVEGSISRHLDMARYNLSFGVHPYAHSVLGTPEDIADMPNEFEYSREFFERFYTPENVVLQVYGDVDVDEAMELIVQYWGGWMGGEHYTQDIPQEPARDESLYKHIEWPEGSTPWLSLDFSAANFTVEEPDTAALDIIQFMVFSAQSDLYRKLVTEEQTAISLSAWYYWSKDPNLFTIEANVASVDKMWYVRDEILKALAQLRTEEVTNERLDTVKSNLKYKAALGLTSTENIADTIQYYAFLNGDPESFNKLYSYYDTITPATIVEVANKYFTDARLATITLAHAEDVLPTPPAPVLNGANKLAGSVDGYVKAAAQGYIDSENFFKIDEVIIPSNTSKLVYFDIRFRVGSTDDEEGKEGLAAVTAKMISSGGSASMSLEKITEAFFPMSAYLSGSAGKEYTYFDGAIHVDNLDRYFDIIKSMLLEPGFRKEDFERIRTDLIRNIQDSLFDDGFVAARAFDSEVFDDHPYSKPNAGMIASLNALTLDDVKDFYAAKYTKQNVILGLAGGIPDGFVTKVVRSLQRLPSGPVDKKLLAAPPAKPASTAIVIQQEATQATTVTFGYSLPLEIMNSGHPEYAALRIAMRYYGDGSFTSRLMSEIRVKRGINYGNSASLRFEGLAFQVNIGAADTAESAHFATRLAMFELNKLIEDGLTQADFEFVRNRWFNVLPVAVDTPAHVLSLAIDGHEYGYGDSYLDYMQGELSNVTLDEVNAAARKWLQDEFVTYVFVTPDAADLKARLVDGTTSLVAYSTDVVADNVTAIDDIVKDYPLGLDASNVKIMTAEELFPDTVPGAINQDTLAPGLVAVGRDGPTDEKDGPTDETESSERGVGFDVESDSPSRQEANSGAGALFSSYSGGLCGLILSSLSMLLLL